MNLAKTLGSKPSLRPCCRALEVLRVTWCWQEQMPPWWGTLARLRVTLLWT